MVCVDIHDDPWCGRRRPLSSGEPRLVGYVGRATGGARPVSWARLRPGAARGHDAGGECETLVTRRRYVGSDGRMHGHAASADRLALRLRLGSAATPDLLLPACCWSFSWARPRRRRSTTGPDPPRRRRLDPGRRRARGPGVLAPPSRRRVVGDVAGDAWVLGVGRRAYLSLIVAFFLPPPAGTAGPPGR